MPVLLPRWDVVSSGAPARHKRSVGPRATSATLICAENDIANFYNMERWDEVEEGLEAEMESLEGLEAFREGPRSSLVRVPGARG